MTAQVWPLPLRLLSRLPLPLWYRLASALAALAPYLNPRYRKLVRENLGRCFPALDRAGVDALTARFYRHLADVAVETVKGATIDRDELLRRVRFENPELLDGYAARGQSVLLLTTHQCNWEWLLLASSARLALPLYVVYRPLSQRWLERLFVALRTRFGARLLASDRAVLKLRRHPRAVGIAIVADQTPKKTARKHWTDWFGQPTAFALGPETLARLTALPVVFVAMRRAARGYYDVRFEPLAEAPYGEHAVTERYAAACEAQIRAAPSDWLWSYKRWRYRRS